LSKSEIEIQKTKRAQINEEKIIEELSTMSSNLKKITDRDEKIKVLINLNEFIKEYKDIIKKRCPDKLVSILNSL
jgi:hypothetical protein